MGEIKEKADEISNYEDIDSTNEASKRTKLKKDFNLIVSETQTRGKGRHGKKWLSSKSGNIYMSISTEKELESYLKRVDKKVYLFPEYRNHPIKMTDFLPLRWTREKNEVNGLSDEVSKGEYYTFQVGLYSPFNEINDIDITRGLNCATPVSYTHLTLPTNREV